MLLFISHYIISNTFHWMRAVGYIGTYPIVLYFLRYILVAQPPATSRCYVNMLLYNRNIGSKWLDLFLVVVNHCQVGYHKGQSVCAVWGNLLYLALFPGPQLFLLHESRHRAWDL